jgi:hypothetical protein
VAVIAPQDEVFWMARTYEVLREGSPERVRVFRQLAEAERWLDSCGAKATTRVDRRLGSRGATPPW